MLQEHYQSDKVEGLDQDQDQRSVGPDLGPNCLQTERIKQQIRVLLVLILSSFIDLPFIFYGWTSVAHESILKIQPTNHPQMLHIAILYTPPTGIRMRLDVESMRTLTERVRAFCTSSRILMQIRLRIHG